MRNYFITILLFLFILTSCGNSNKKQIEYLNHMLEEEKELLEQDYYELQVAEDNDEINEYSSNFIGKPVTNRELRENGIRNRISTIRQIQGKIQELQTK